MNPLEPLIDQISDILRKTEAEVQNPSDKPVPPELLKQVAKLEKLVMAFVTIHQILLKGSGIDENKVEQIISHVPEKTLAKDKMVLEKLAKLKEIAIEAKDLFERESKKAKGAATDKKTKKREMTKRKSKFRGIDEGKWKKL